MTPEQLDHFRRKLLEQREELEARAYEARTRAQEVLDPLETGDEAEIRSDLADTSLIFGTLNTTQRHAIDDALLRIETGEYGICEVCGTLVLSEAVLVIVLELVIAFARSSITITSTIASRSTSTKGR